MSLYETLMTWPRERLAKELQGQARDNAALKRRVLQLEIELFWLKATPLTATADLIQQISECAGGMVNGNLLARRAKAAVAIDGTALGLRLVLDPNLPPGIAEVRGDGAMLVARIENIAPSPAELACWCTACLAADLGDFRTVICPTCGRRIE